MAIVPTKPPFNTKKLLTDREFATFRTIADRLLLGNTKPPLVLENHIAQMKDKTQKPEKEISSLRSTNSTLDGIKFDAVDPKALARIFYDMKDSDGNGLLTSMKEDPDHWPLAKSYGKTVGTGWREPWRPVRMSLTEDLPAQSGHASNLFRMRFGSAGTPMRFTSLHCSVDEVNGHCNIHIDESGFVLALPKGVSLTLDAYDHWANELLLKTEFRDWLMGKTSSETVKKVIAEVIRRISFQFPNASNGYAGLHNKVKSLRRPQHGGDVIKTAWGLAKPTGMTIDAYDKGDFKVQVTGTMHGGDRTITLT
ncbi:MAG: hypothetical protein O3A63_00885, partial [Proteobacteria bacterium]|nr:hypothetical protein [Pseudomonadota bacterium]